ncbi:hypothetical protein [Paenibacillus sp. A3]|uniref:hypothetical protein n=1 Tax=Paenibacillus sp. A3 TaxID=1337054 RepID=UPI0012FA13E8|nr:hypothetical protein [Paenibacillus sp. A3]
MKAQPVKSVTEQPLAFALREIRYAEKASEWSQDSGAEELRLTSGMLLLIYRRQGTSAPERADGAAFLRQMPAFVLE